MERRELWETIVDVLTAVGAPPVVQRGLTVQSIEIDLPVEIVAQITPIGFRLLVDAPNWRWEDRFSLRSGRLQMVLLKDDYDQLRR